MVKTYKQKNGKTTRIVLESDDFHSLEREFWGYHNWGFSGNYVSRQGI
jgi:hypothetical protein